LLVFDFSGSLPALLGVPSAVSIFLHMLYVGTTGALFLSETTDQRKGWLRLGGFHLLAGSLLLPSFLMPLPVVGISISIIVLVFSGGATDRSRLKIKRPLTLPGSVMLNLFIGLLIEVVYGFVGALSIIVA
jgi:uncharacterized membrane protein